MFTVLAGVVALAIGAAAPPAESRSPLPAGRSPSLSPCGSGGPSVGAPCAGADGAALFRDSAGGVVTHFEPVASAPAGWWAYADERYVLSVSPRWVVLASGTGDLRFVGPGGAVTGGLRRFASPAGASGPGPEGSDLRLLPGTCTVMADAALATPLGRGRAYQLRCLPGLLSGAAVVSYEQHALLAAGEGTTVDVWLRLDGSTAELPAAALAVVAGSLRLRRP